MPVRRAGGRDRRVPRCPRQTRPAAPWASTAASKASSGNVTASSRRSVWRRKVRRSPDQISSSTFKTGKLAAAPERPGFRRRKASSFPSECGMEMTIGFDMALTFRTSGDGGSQIRHEGFQAAHVGASPVSASADPAGRSIAPAVEENRAKSEKLRSALRLRPSAMRGTSRDKMRTGCAWLAGIAIHVRCKFPPVICAKITR